MNRRYLTALLALLLLLGNFSMPLTAKADSYVKYLQSKDTDAEEVDVLDIFKESKRDPEAFAQRENKPAFNEPIFTQDKYLENLHKNAPKEMVRIWIGNFYVLSDVYPFVENQRTYVPIRFIAEALGYDVEWNGATRQVFIRGAGKTITLTIDSDIADINGQKYSLDAPARIRHDRTFVPLRFIAEAFGETVDYYAGTRVVTVGEGYQESTPYPIKYYTQGLVFVTEFKITFINKIIYLANGKQLQFNDDRQLYVSVGKYIDDYIYDYVYVQPYVPLKDRNSKGYKDTKVQEDKRLKDEYYVAPDADDPILGSWYGLSGTYGTKDYYDAYTYIEKVGPNKYHITERCIKSDGSELVTLAYARYNQIENAIETEKSYKTAYASGQFNYKWYTRAGKYILNGYDYMYWSEDSRIYKQKY